MSIIEISEPEALEIIKTATAKTVLQSLVEKVKNLDHFDSQSFQPLMKEIQKEKEIKGPLLWKPVRVALTGVVSGPDLHLVIDVFGKKKVTDILNQVIEKYTN